MKKLIINLAPTGMIPTKAMTRFVPQSPQEIIEDVLECTKIGISMVHLHARDSDGKPAYDPNIYAEIIAGIREKSDIVIVVSTSGRNFPEYEKRSLVLNLEGQLKPDMASLTLSSVNFNKIASISSPETIMQLAVKMRDAGIKPELEIFDLGMVNYAHYLIRKGLLVPPYYFNIILGNIAAAQAKLLHLGLLVSELPPDSFWSVGGIGNWQKPMNAIGVIAGDGVRVGLEDNIWFDDARNVLATNQMLVNRVVQMANNLERCVALPEDVRKYLGLKKVDNK